MPGSLAKIKHQWRAFAHDEQHRRLKQSGKPLLVALAVLGGLLVAGGVVMLFVPGPGFVVVAFGLAVLAGTSERLARALDRVEPVVRRVAQRAKAWWSHAPLAVRIALSVLAAALAAAAAYGAYRLWFA
jgi:hypothetical protein